MVLIEEEAVLSPALPLPEFKDHLRLGTGFSNDDVQDPILESFLRAAVAAIEARTNKILLERLFSWTLKSWGDDQEQALPVAPVNQIVNVTLSGPNEDTEIINPAHYRLQKDTQRPLLVPTGARLPTIVAGGTVEILFRAGYAADFRDIPADLSQAVMLLAAHYYEFRNDTGLGNGCMPFGVTSLIERYRTVRLFAGGSGR